VLTTACFLRESTIRTMEEGLEEAEKHADRCEALAALMVVAKGKLEQARATVAERATAA
jgi:hypothetical protein